MRLLGRQSAAPHRFLKRLIRVRNFERNVAHAVAMSADMFGRIIVGRHGRGQNEICLALTHGIRSPLSLPGFQSAVSDLRKTESLAIKVSRLPRIAHPEFDVVNAFQLEWILHPIPPDTNFIFFHLLFVEARPARFSGVKLQLPRELHSPELHSPPRDATNDSTWARPLF